MVEEKHITVCKNVNTYLQRLIERLEIDTVEQPDHVDILGSLDELSKAAKKYVDAAKKNLDFNGKKEIKGQIFKVKISEIQKSYFNPAIVRDELPDADFLRCITVNKKNLETFLTKDRIKEIQEDAGIESRFKFESL